MDIRIHKILQGSSANGPGIRNTVWFQGCTLNCPACFNPLTHDPVGGRKMSVSSVCGKLLAPSAPCEGITVSGGEPFLQAEGLTELLRLIRGRSPLGTLVFSGYTRAQLSELFPDVLRSGLIDALICGPYRSDLPPAYERFCSSANQELVLLTGRYTEEDFKRLPLSELIIEADGTATHTGILF